MKKIKGLILNCKRILTIVISVAGAFLFTSNTTAQALPSEPPSSSFRQKAIFEGIASEEYQLNWQDAVGTMQAPNRANNFRATFYRDGFTAEPRDPRRFLSEPNDPRDLNERARAEVAYHWKLGIVLKSYGESNALDFSKPPETAFDKNTARFSTDQITVNYTNDTNGLHQTFVVNQRPARGNLNITLGVTSLG